MNVWPLAASRVVVDLTRIPRRPFGLRHLFIQFAIGLALWVPARAASAAPPVPSGSVLPARFPVDSETRFDLRDHAIRDLTSSDPKVVAAAVQSLRDASGRLTSRQTAPIEILLRARHYDDAEQFAITVAIAQAASQRAYADAERLRAGALLAQGKFSEALSAARSFYDCARLRDTLDAVKFVAACLAAARPNDPGVDVRFKQEQFDRASALSASSPTTQPDDWPKSSILAAIPVDEKAYSDAADALDPDLDGPNANNTYKTYLMKGNLLLLAGRAQEAEDVFERSASAKRNKPADVIENVARAIRAEERGKKWARSDDSSTAGGDRRRAVV